MPENNEQQPISLTAVQIEGKNLPNGESELEQAAVQIGEKNLPNGESELEQVVSLTPVQVEGGSLPSSDAELERAAHLAAARKRALARRRRRRYAALENNEQQPVQLAAVNSGQQPVQPPAVNSGQRMVYPTTVNNAPQIIHPAAVKKKASRHFFFIALAIPTLCAFLYFTFLASPMYVSQASFAVRKADGNVSAASGIAAAMLGSSGSSAWTDPFIINDYIQSLDIVQDIDKELDLVKHYTARSHDVISRLWQKPTQDDLLKYWRWIMVPQLTRDTGIISVEARAYSPEMAQKIAQAVLVRSEALVNAMNERSRNDAVALAHKEVERAEERVKAAQGALKEFRNVHAVLDLKTTAAGLQDIVAKLETEATVLRTKIAETSAYMRSNTPVLKAYRQRLAAVEDQLAMEKQRVAGNAAAENNLNSLVADYEELSREAEFAQQQLVSAMSALEAARVQQATQSSYVVAYQQPTLPDKSLYPRPLLFTLYTFLGSLIVLGLFSLIWASIREHAGF